MAFDTRGRGFDRPLPEAVSAIHTNGRRHLMSEAELSIYFERLEIPNVGQARVRHIRNNLPSRATRSNKASGKSRYVSLKMPFAIEAEAMSTEYVYLVEADHDDQVLEIYQQPEGLKISYLGKNQKRITTTPITPDFFIIEINQCYYVECKREEELVKLSAEYPHRYKKDANGDWISPPGEQAAADFGFGFRIRSSTQNNWTAFENYELLKDYYANDLPTASNELRTKLNEAVFRDGWISIFELVHGDLEIPADFIYAAIVRGEIFFPIRSYRLSDQANAYIFRDKATYRSHEIFMQSRRSRAQPNRFGVDIKPGAMFTWDGNLWRIINPGSSSVTIQRIADNGEHILAELSYESVVEMMSLARITAHKNSFVPSEDDAETILKTTSSKELQDAMWRYEMLFGEVGSDNPFKACCKRSIFYWKRHYGNAEARYGNGFVGLIRHRTGNCLPKTSTETLQLALDVIDSDWETIRNKKRSVSYGKFCNLAEGMGLQKLSYVRFCELVKERGGHQQTKKRIGEDAAYDLEPQFLQLEYTTPVHGVRAWHIGHIDHTPIPLKFVHSQLAKVVETIWLTLLIDATTRKILAYYLTFDKPSYRSCMMVLRDCVRRHNRVPQIIVSDQGGEFNGIYYETQLAFLCITKRERRSKRPRDGSVIERIFNTSIVQFISNLMGSTDVADQYFRRVSWEIDPVRHAIWTMDKFDIGFQTYTDEVYHRNYHGGIGMSPDQAMALSLKSHGNRAHRLIPYDHTFIAQSCPAVHRGTAKVTPQGIKVNYNWYKCANFQFPGVLDTQVQARYDPFNAGLAYAFVDGKWCDCYSSDYALFSQYSERAIKLATERLRLTDRKAGSHMVVNSSRLALFLEGREAEELLETQMINDNESRNHREKVANTNSRDVKGASPFQNNSMFEANRPPKMLEDL